MSSVLSVKLEREKMKVLEEIAGEENTDRSAVARKLLDMGIRQWRIDRAVQLILSNKVSVWKASELAGVSLREMLDILSERRITWVKITPDEFELSRLERRAHEIRLQLDASNPLGQGGIGLAD